MDRTRYLAIVVGLPLLAGGLAPGCRDGKGKARSPVRLAESFTAVQSLGSWKRTLGATTGAGPVSRIAWDQGALRLSGDAGTQRWIALTREVDVRGKDWIRVSARIRTDGVNPAGARYRNCNVYVKHGSKIVTTAVVTGTQKWTQVRRRFPLSSGAERVTVGLLLSMPGRAWFDDVRVEATAAPPWKKFDIDHYRYFVLPGAGISKKSHQHNEASYRMVSRFLGVSKPARVPFYRYPDEATKAELTGRGGNAHRTDQVIHSIFPSDRHEIVHVLGDAWGDPPALVAEGLAVFLSGGWQGKPVRAYAQDLARIGKWTPPSAILATAGFRSRPDRETYAIGGAFVEWVLLLRGKKTLRALYRRLANRASRQQNQRRMEKLLGTSMVQIDSRFRAWVVGAPSR